MGDAERQKADAKRQKANAKGSGATLRLAGLTQSLGEAPEGFSWGRLAEYLCPRRGITAV